MAVHYRGKPRRYDNAENLPFLPWEKWDVGLFIQRFEKLYKKINAEEPRKTPNAASIYKITASEWFNTAIWTKAGMDMANVSMEATLGTSTFCGQLIACAILLQALGTADGAQDRLIVGGGQAIANKI